MLFIELIKRCRSRRDFSCLTYLAYLPATRFPARAGAAFITKAWGGQYEKVTNYTAHIIRRNIEHR